MATSRMREGSTTDDYRAALSGNGEFLSLGYEWTDKPHRLVYDLCGEVDYLQSLLAETLPALRRQHAMTAGGRKKSDALGLVRRVENALGGEP